jgi:DNA-binding beta-propeller fold protein YncE
MCHINRLALAVLTVLGLAWAAYLPAQYEYVSGFGELGDAPGEFNNPTQVAFDAEGNIIVADTDNLRVQICSRQGACSVLGGAEPLMLNYPFGVAVDLQDRIIVGEFFGSRVNVCQANQVGDCTIQFGSGGQDLGQFEGLFNLAITSSNHIVTTEADNNRIQVCDAGGSCTGFGGPGSALGQFSYPTGVAVDQQDRIIVADTFNNRIQVCSQTGTCSAFGSEGTNLGEFSSLFAVAVDHAERIIAVENAVTHRVSLCDYDGDCTQIGQTGNNAGEFFFPSGVAADGNGWIAIADQNMHRIQLFRDTAFEQPGFRINAGLNDAWYSQATSGQGFFIIIYPNIPYVFLAWFTYDTERPPANVAAMLGEPGQRWLTAEGPFDGNTAALTIVNSEGMIFDSGTPAVIRDIDYGTIDIVWSDCENATLDYDIPAVSRSGSINLKRVTNDNVALCQGLSR